MNTNQNNNLYPKVMSVLFVVMLIWLFWPAPDPVPKFLQDSNNLFYQFIYARGEARSLGLDPGSCPEGIEADGENCPIIVGLSDYALPEEKPAGASFEGLASWYDYDLDPITGKSSLCPPSVAAVRDCYTETHLTAAARDFVRGTRLRVRLVDSPRHVDVVVTDFGPDPDLFPLRIIDLSSAAFKKLSPISAGVIRVEVTPLLPTSPSPSV